MTFIAGTAVSGTTPATTLTVPVGVTAGMHALIVFARGDGTDWDPVPAKSGATFTLVDDRAATNLRVTVWTATGLVAGDTITVSATVNGLANAWHVYQDEFSYNVGTLAASVRGVSAATSVSGSLTPAAGQTVAVIGVERTTATGTVVSSAASTGAETVTQRLFSEETSTVSSTYVATFVASAAASRTVTLTYNTASTNGYAALITTTPLTVPTPPSSAVFPADPLPVVVQAKVDGTSWTTITGDVYTADGITVQRGQANEQSKAEPTKIDLTLNNRSGNYSPRNPAGAYYGLLSRNTELRVGIAESSTWLDVPGPTGTVLDPGQYAQTPDHASLDITGTVDLRFEADFDTWRETLELVSKAVDATNQRSYSLTLGADGRLLLYRSVDGITYNWHSSRYPVPITRGRLAVRGVYAPDNGAGGRTTTYYTAPTLAGPWTVLDTLTTSGTLSIFAGTAPLTILDNPDSNVGKTAIQGRVYGAEVRDGVGTIVAKPDFTAQLSGATSFTDVAGRVWSMTGTTLTNLNVRGHGEVSAWPSRWDVSGRDVWAPVQVAGLTRRLGQGAAPLNSAMFRGETSDADADVVAYWPVEDSEGTETIAAGRTGGRAMTPEDDDNTSYASFSGFPGSDPIATLGDKSIWNGSIRSYSGVGRIQVWWLMAVPLAGTTNNQGIISVTSTGAIGRVVARYYSTGGMNVQVFDQNDALLATGVTLGYAVNGKLLKCSLDIYQTGINVTVDLKTLEVGQSIGATGSTVVGSTNIGRAVGVQVSPGANFPDVAIGHISVHNTIRSLFDSFSELNGWRGERAGRRMQRLCREEGVPFRSYGDLDDTVQMGAQSSKPVLELLQECADADGGILSESRDALSISYVPRSSMQSQPAAHVTLPYSFNRDLEPIEDDTSIANDVTVSRPAGGSARVELLEGALSVNQPPTGVGRYQTSETPNLGYDSQLLDAANWRVHTGTVDEARFPTIGIGLEHPDIAGDAALVELLRTMDLGDRLVISGPMPAWISPDNVDQVVLGTTEILGVYEHEITANCVPYRPYRVGIYDELNKETRYDTAGSVLATGVSASATVLSITTTTGPVWTQAPASFPFAAKLGPERVTVTGISGATSPQSVTVVRAVNSVSMAHLAGTEFGLADPSYYGL